MGGTAFLPSWTQMDYSLDILQEKEPSIYDDGECFVEMGPGRYYPDLMMCGYPAAGLYDRGSPLVCPGGLQIVCGLASNTMLHAREAVCRQSESGCLSCASSGYDHCCGRVSLIRSVYYQPGIYAEVAAF